MTGCPFGDGVVLLNAPLTLTIEEGNAQGSMLSGILVDSALAVQLHIQLCIQKNPRVLTKKQIGRSAGVCFLNQYITNLCLTYYLHLSLSMLK